MAKRGRKKKVIEAINKIAKEAIESANITIKESEEKIKKMEKQDSKKKQLPKKVLLAMKEIEKKFGKGIIKTANSESLIINRLPTGIKSLDEALGGGFPIGMITELYGEESGGKSTIVAKLIANAQKLGYLCAYIDAEHALEEKWIKKLGVDCESMLHSETTDADNIFDVVKGLLNTKEVKLLVVDSIAAMTPKKEVSQDMEKQSMGVLAKIVNKGLRVSNTVNTRQGTAIVFINQIRDNLGVMYGPKTTTPGGKGMKFFAAIRIEVKRGEWWPNKDKKDRKGFEVICRIIKNKTSVPYTEARFILINDTGETVEWDEANKMKKKNADIETNNVELVEDDIKSEDI